MSARLAAVVADHVAAGKAEFLVGALEALDRGDRRFDLVFAVRVRAFTPTSSGHERWCSLGSRRERVRSFMESPG